MAELDQLRLQMVLTSRARDLLPPSPSTGEGAGMGVVQIAICVRTPNPPTLAPSPASWRSRAFGTRGEGSGLTIFRSLWLSFEVIQRR